MFFSSLFKLLILFPCFLYLSISDCLLYLFAVLRIRSRFLISLPSSLLNHGRSILRTVTILVGMHSLATLGNVSVKVLHISSTSFKGPDGSMSWVVGLPNNSYKPITNTTWVRAQLCKLQKGCTRLAAASDKSLPVACPWSMVLSGNSGFFHH